MKIKRIIIISPWTSVFIIIFVVSIYFYFFLLPHSEKMEELEGQKKAFEDKIGKLKGTEVMKDGYLIEKEYYDGEILIATDRFDSKGTIFRRDYYNKNNQSFATDSYEAGKVIFTQYYDSQRNVIVIPPWIAKVYP